MNDDDSYDGSTIRDASSPERSIAGYRLVRELGAGGMGVVYEAEQRTPRRQVALKLIRGGLGVDEQRVKLFEREAHALARLKHPSIATLYEMGSTDEGQPFFAMELVRGVSLDEALSDPSRLGAAGHVERLRLFIRICEAVNYAHQRGVIHRDLKPTNILVTTSAATPASGGPHHPWEVKILDFGLARITDTDLAATESLSAGVVQGTLAYMSPEQARGNPDEIDLRSDVYSLGVILYEMLTGQRPYEVEGRSTVDLLRVICEEPPRRPREVARDGASGRAHRPLDRDLETIVLKSLEKDASLRYQSALALAEDLERHLADQPILARPPTALYQLRKLVSRHKAGFGFATVLLALLAAFAVLMTVQAERVARERDRAEMEAARASAINDFMQETLGSANPVEGRGRDTTVREALVAAAERVGEAFPEQPDIEGAVRHTIGLTHYRLGNFEEAEGQLRAALEVQRRLSAQESSTTYTTLVNLAVAVHDQGRYREAEALYREALETADQVPDLEPGLFTATLNNLGLLLLDRGDAEEAEAIFQRVVERDRDSAGGNGADLGIDLNNLARAMQERGRLQEAERVYREALAILSDRDHPYAPITMGNLAAVTCALGDYSRADPMFEKALAKGGEILGEGHTEVASMAARRGICLMRNGQLERAEATLRQAHRNLTLALGERHPRTQQVLDDLGELLESTGRDAEAAAYRVVPEPAS